MYQRFYHLIFIPFLVLISLTAQGHQMSTAYLSGELDSSGGFVGELQVRLYDLERSLELDRDKNRQLTWSETLSQESHIKKYLNERLHIYRGDDLCSTSFSGLWQIDNHFNENYLVLPLRAQCNIRGNIEIDYSGFFDIDNNHKLLLSVSEQSQTYNRVISEENSKIQWSLQDGNTWTTFKEFVWEGVIHIWIGTDHILFLICLLLACVFGLNNNPNMRSTALQVLLVVTSFTLAHSLTLTATALQWIQVPSRWVEVGIAVTVLASALNNIFSWVSRLTWVTFGFGLLHGMGFAGVLSELGLPSDQQWLTVLAFNLGVELGQIVIIFLVLPLLFAIKRFSLNTRYWLTGGSSFIAVVALQWIVQRIAMS